MLYCFFSGINMTIKVRYIKGFERYTIDESGVVTDTETGLVRPVDTYVGRGAQTNLQLPTGKYSGRNIQRLLKATFPENYEIVPSSETIYHVEGTIPDIPLNTIQLNMRKYFRYDLEEGILYDVITGENATHQAGNGYLEVNRYSYRGLAHNLITVYMLGIVFPNSEVDHVDHDRANNKWDNLRIVCRKANSRNLSKHRSNTSGVSGVNWHKTKNKWRAYIMVDYKQVHLGLFTAFEEAVRVRKEAEKKYGFHENHGK